jgi:hypothetical protein
VSTFTEIRESVVSLSKPERAELAILLLGSLDDTHYWVEDEEVERRSAELDSGAVVGVNKEELRKNRVCRERATETVAPPFSCCCLPHASVFLVPP